jgi:hypothetical protein
VIYQAVETDAKEMGTAKTVAETLHAHYPGHLWMVMCRDGLIVIKNLHISHRYGMVMKQSDMYSAAELQRQVIRNGGEFLERAKLEHVSEGQRARQLEGAEKWKPWEAIGA